MIITRRARECVGRSIAFLIWLAALTPIGVECLMWSEAIRAFRYLGRWPSYDQPDPKDLPLTVINVCMDSGVIGFCGVIAALVILWMKRRLPVRLVLSLALVALVALWIVALILGRVDPGGVVGWAVD